MSLRQLSEWGLPTPAFLVITPATLDRLLVQSRQLAKLQTQLESWRRMRPTQREAELRSFFASLPLNQAFLSEIRQAYQTKLNRGEVIVRTEGAATSSAPTQVENSPVKVKGVVAILRAFKNCWAEMINEALNTSKIATTNPLAPGNLLIIASPPAEWQGSITNLHPDALHKSALVIEVVPPRRAFKSRQPWRYQIDRRTETIIARPQLSRQRWTPPAAQPEPASLLELSRQAERAFRAERQALTLHWQLVAGKPLWLTHSLPSSPPPPRPHPHPPLATKLYLELSEAHQAGTLLPQSAGIGLFNSNQLINAQGLHPLAILRQRLARYQLEHAHRQVLSSLLAQLRPHQTTFAYRLYHSPLASRRKLKFATNYEPEESAQTHPFNEKALYLQHPAWLDFELALLAKHRAHWPSHGALLLPGIREPKQLRSIWAQIKNSPFYHQQRPQLWLQIETPAVLFNLSWFTSAPINCWVFDWETILAHLQGEPRLSSNQSELEWANSLRLLDLIDRQQAQFPISERPQSVLNSRQVTAKLAQRLVALGWSGLLTTPADFPLTRALLVDAERNLFKR